MPHALNHRDPAGPGRVSAAVVAPTVVRALSHAYLPDILAFIGALGEEDSEALCADFKALDWAGTAVFGWFQGGILRAVASAHGGAAPDRAAALAIIAHPDLRRDLALDMLLICTLPETPACGRGRGVVPPARTEGKARRRATLGNPARSLHRLH